MPKIEKNVSTERQNEIMDRVYTYRGVAESGNMETRHRMAENLRYVTGDQWDPQAEAANKRKKKVCVTVPLIRPQVKLLEGQIVQNPKDLVLANQHGGMKMLADLQSVQIKHVLNDQNVKFETQHWFSSGVSTMAGYLLTGLDPTRNPEFGDLSVQNADPFDVWPDPTVKVYDWNQPGKGAKFCIYEPWIDKDWVKARWPEKEALLDTTWGTQHRRSFTQHLMGSLFGIRRKEVSTQSGDVLHEDFTSLKTRLQHTWWREPATIWYFYDLRQGEAAMPLVLTTQQEVSQARKVMKQFPGVYSIAEVLVQQMNHTLSVGDVFLENRIDELNLLPTAEAKFPITPFYPYFDSGIKSTIVDDLIGAQDIVNFSESAKQNMLKAQLNRGWRIRSDLNNRRAWLEAHGSEDGLVINESEFGGRVEQIMPPPYSTGYREEAQNMRNTMHEITGIRTGQPEHDSTQISGRALAIKEANSRTGTSSIMANFDYSFHMFGTLILKVLQSNPIYSENEIMEMVEEEKIIAPEALNEARVAVANAIGIRIPDPVQFNEAAIMNMPAAQAEDEAKRLEDLEADRQQIIAEIDKQAKPLVIRSMISALRNPRAGRFQMTVITSNAAPTARFREFSEVLEINETLINSGQLPLSRDTILEASDLPNKDREMGRTPTNPPAAQ